MTGYVKAHRVRFGHSLFKASKSNPYCRGFAWDWMVARACWKRTTYDVRGRTVAVERGQFIASPDEMAAAWGWSRSAVIRFMTRLKTEQMIEHEAGQGKTLITICNYERYQGDEAETGHMSGHVAGQKPDTNRTPKEKGKEREEGKEKKEREPRKRGCALQPEWVPSDRNVTDAEARGFSQQEIDHEASRFRDYHLARGTVFKDWDAAWRTWLGKARTYGRSGSMAGAAGPPRNGQGGTIASIAAWRRATGQV